MPSRCLRPFHLTEQTVERKPHKLSSLPARVNRPDFLYLPLGESSVVRNQIAASRKYKSHTAAEKCSGLSIADPAQAVSCRVTAERRSGEGSPSIEHVPPSNLTRLHLDGVRQAHRTLGQLSNREVLPMLDIPPERTGLHPLKAPGVFYRDDGI